MDTIVKDLGKIAFTAAGEWDINKSYERLDIVYIRIKDKTYFAKQDVPKGIDIENEDYWQNLSIHLGDTIGIICLNSVDSSTGKIKEYEGIRQALQDVSIERRVQGAFLIFNEYGTLSIYYYIGLDTKDATWNNITNWISLSDDHIRSIVLEVLISNNPNMINNIRNIIWNYLNDPNASQQFKEYYKNIINFYINNTPEELNKLITNSLTHSSIINTRINNYIINDPDNVLSTFIDDYIQNSNSDDFLGIFIKQIIREFNNDNFNNSLSNEIDNAIGHDINSDVINDKLKESLDNFISDYLNGNATFFAFEEDSVIKQEINKLIDIKLSDTDPNTAFFNLAAININTEDTVKVTNIATDFLSEDELSKLANILNNNYNSININIQSCKVYTNNLQTHTKYLDAKICLNGNIVSSNFKPFTIIPINNGIYAITMKVEWRYNDDNKLVIMNITFYTKKISSFNITI